MFEQLHQLPADPLLGLITQHRSDPRPNKIDLGVGVYRDEQGNTPVLASVKAAETFLLKTEESKAYVGPAGNIEFSKHIAELIFGEHQEAIDSRLVSLQTPGGCGALRVLAETIVRADAQTQLWVSDPTWANHVPLLGGAGLAINTYPYYDFENTGIRFAAMLESLNMAKPKDVVLLHGCCHNPSGADLSEAQWRQVIDLCLDRQLIPLIDVAYQGFGKSLEQDAFGVRLAAEYLPEVMVAISCSKNFGLYRERVGAAFVLCQDAKAKAACASHMMTITRGLYSMPPSHGASIVACIANSDELSEQWRAELDAMRSRLIAVRSSLRQMMRQSLELDQFAFIEQEKGMFSFLGLSEVEVSELAKECGIYMASTSRISLAGLNSDNLPYFVSSLSKLISAR